LIDEKDNKKIEKAILDYVGVLGFGKAGYMKVKSLGGRVVGSVVRSEVEKVRAGLGLVGVGILKVSGTLKGLGK